MLFLRQLSIFFVLLALAVSARAQQRSEPEGDDELNSRRQGWLLKRRAGPDGKLSPAARLKAIETMQRMSPPQRRVKTDARGPEMATSTHWTNIGPQPLQAYGTQYSGRVWGITPDPRNQAVIYIGTDSGGVWKTTDGGTDWTPLTDAQPSQVIHSLAMASSTPDTLYAGTAQPQPAGILKSTDGGNTWTRIPLGGPLNYGIGSEASIVDSIVVHPFDSQTVFAAADGQFLRSTDGGATWHSTFSGLGDGATLSIDLANPNRVYAGGGTVSRILVSLDGGSTWNTAAGSGPRSLPLLSGTPLVGFAVAPSNANIVYAALRRTTDDVPFFYKTTDGGANWTAIASPLGGQINYWPWTMSVHPTNPDIVYAGCVGLSRSVDGGQTWSDIGNPAGSAVSIHVDQHPLIFTKDKGTLLVGNDGGVYSTANPAGAISWSDLNSTLSTVLFYPGMSIHPTNSELAFAGAQDNGTERYRAGTGWDEVACGDGGWTAIDPQNPDNVYAACNGIQVNKSADGGSTFSLANGNIDTTDVAEFIPPLVIDPSNPARLYFGTYRVWLTINQAATWTAISPGVSGCGECGLNSIAVAPSDGNTVYTAGQGKVFVSRNALSGPTATWVDRSPTLPLYAVVTQIRVHPTDPQTAYATVGNTGVGHVYKTTDAGVSWTDLTANLPDMPANDIIIDPDIPKTLYLATDTGVFRSVDDGGSWVPMASGLPVVIVNSLALHRPTRTLRAATYGRGAWEILVPVGSEVPVAIRSTLAGAPFELEDGTTYRAPITFGWAPGSKHTVTWLSPGGPGVRYVFQSWADGEANPRAIAVGSVAASYTAAVKAQYQLTISITPAMSGTVSTNPGSADSFFDAGTSVTLNTVPASGYASVYFSGDPLDTLTPPVISMTQPHSVTANFYCDYQMVAELPTETGPGANSGVLIWTTGSGCPGSITGSAGWVSLGTPRTAGVFNEIPYSISENTGASRSAVFEFNGGPGYTSQMTVSQDAAGSAKPNIVAASPNTGSGLSQVFSFAVSDSAGYADIKDMDLLITGLHQNTECSSLITFQSNGTASLSLLSDSNLSYSNPVTLPGTGTLQNSSCVLSAGALKSLGQVSPADDQPLVAEAAPIREATEATEPAAAIPDEPEAATATPVAQETPDVAPEETPATKKTTSRKNAPKAPKAAKTPRESSKTAQVVAMLQRQEGATLSEIMTSMGWQRHTVRGFMAGAMKKSGYAVESFKPEGGERTYRIPS